MSDILRHAPRPGPKLQWEIVWLFVSSFGMAGLMIIGAVTSYHWLIAKFQ